MTDTTNHYEYKCSKCGQKCRVYWHRFTYGGGMDMSMCCNSTVRPVVVTSKVN